MARQRACHTYLNSLKLVSLRLSEYVAKIAESERAGSPMPTWARSAACASEAPRSAACSFSAHSRSSACFSCGAGPPGSGASAMTQGCSRASEAGSGQLLSIMQPHVTPDAPQT